MLFEAYADRIMKLKEYSEDYKKLKKFIQRSFLYKDGKDKKISICMFY